MVLFSRTHEPLGSRRCSLDDRWMDEYHDPLLLPDREPADPKEISALLEANTG
jgi:hypothetical protein